MNFNAAAERQSRLQATLSQSEQFCVVQNAVIAATSPPRVLPVMVLVKY